MFEWTNLEDEKKVNAFPHCNFSIVFHELDLRDPYHSGFI